MLHNKKHLIFATLALFYLFPSTASACCEEPTKEQFLASFKTPYMCGENQNIRALVGSSYLPTADTYDGLARAFEQGEATKPQQAEKEWAQASQSGLLGKNAPNFGKGSEYYHYMAQRTATAQRNLQTADMPGWCACAARQLDSRVPDADFPAKGNAGYLRLKQAVEDAAVECLN